ncbi:hypothetical protein HGRIS_011574 [Hohenbuehelia grisea]|uniref:Uncharacterized protein n=1 Tax=Hohenbuehelia grisea TaxID=104357 RepID=A0ABR3JVJ8_9AGAR
MYVLDIPRYSISLTDPSSAAIITDIVANINPLPILGAVALGGSPGISPDIIPAVASNTLLTVLPEFNENNDVTQALQARVDFVEALFKDPNSVPFSIKAQYLGQTVVQPPAVSAQVSMRPQDPSKTFAAGDAGQLQLMVLFGDADKLVVQSGVVSTFQPHFKDLVITTISGGHALFDDNPAGVTNALKSFVTKITTKKREIRSRITGNSTLKAQNHNDRQFSAS